MLIECIIVGARLLPVFMVLLVPVRHYVPYSLDRAESLEAQAGFTENQLSVIFGEEERYLSGELSWHRYTGDIALINQRLGQCRRYIKTPEIPRVRFVCCVLQLGKLRIKHAALTVAKMAISKIDGTDQFTLYAVVFLLPLGLIAVIFAVHRRLKVSTRRKPPYIGIREPPSDVATASDKQSPIAETEPNPMKNRDEDEHQPSKISSSPPKPKKRVCFQADTNMAYGRG